MCACSGGLGRLDPPPAHANTTCMPARRQPTHDATRANTATRHSARMRPAHTPPRAPVASVHQKREEEDEIKVGDDRGKAGGGGPQEGSAELWCREGQRGGGGRGGGGKVREEGGEEGVEEGAWEANERRPSRAASAVAHVCASARVTPVFAAGGSPGR